MVKIEPSDAVADVATKSPESISCFERFHLDYSSRGDRSIAVACEEEGIELDRLLEDLSTIDPEEAPEEDWSSKPLPELIAHLMDSYHVPSRSRLAAMEGLVTRIVSDTDDGGREPFVRLQRLLRATRDDLFPHMLKEETTLFPWVERLSELQPGSEIERPFFGSIRNPMNMMSLEHGYVVELLDEIRRLTNEFTPPEGAGEEIRELYGMLRQFEHHQHLHVHLENNVLFPRAVELEDQMKIVPAEGEK